MTLTGIRIIIVGKKQGRYKLYLPFILNTIIQSIVPAEHELNTVISSFSVFFVFLERIQEGKEKPEPFDFKGFRCVWVRGFEPPAS